MGFRDVFSIPAKIKTTIDGFFTVPVHENALDQEAYIKRIDSGEWKDKLVMGITSKYHDFHVVDPFKAPGVCAIGGMGSGKSVAMMFTVYTHMLCNSENTLYIMVDALKGMVDYKSAFKYKENVVTALMEPEKLIPVMDMLDEELELRKYEFARIGAENIVAYEAKMKRLDPSFKGIARIMLCFEEFHAIPNAKQINFHMNLDKPGSAAYQFKNFMRAGRSYGFNTIIATQRATSDDIPSSLKPGLTTMLAFRVNNPGDAAVANLPGAADILGNQRGRCAWEEGFMQFPYLKEELAVKLLNDKMKPLKAKLLGKQVTDYHMATSGEGTEGFIWVKPLTSLIENRGQFDPKNIAKRILSITDFSFETQGNPALTANLIAERDGVRYAVVVVADRGDASAKAMLNLKSSMGQLNCTKVMCISFDPSVPSPATNLCTSTGGVAIDRDDLEQFAKLYDNKGKFTEKDYEARFNLFALSRDAMAKKETSSKQGEGLDEDEDDDFSSQMLGKASRHRQGLPDNSPYKFRG